MMDSKLLTEIENKINTLDIFDTHEHLMLESERIKKELDFFSVFGAYTNTSLISAGLKMSELKILCDNKKQLNDKWRIFQPFWEFIKYTDDGLVIKTAVNDLFGITEISFEGIKKVNQELKSSNQPGYFKKIIQDKCRINYILNDIDKLEEYGISFTQPDSDIFLPVIRLDHLLDINSAIKIKKLEEEYNITLTCLDNLLDLLDKCFDERRGNIFAVKTAIGYSRDLFFDISLKSDAERVFQKLLSLNDFCNRRNDCLSLNEIKPLQDYLFHYVINKAMEYNLPVQIHTGILDSNANDVRNSNPLNLINLFLLYKNVIFDIFHGGYPYSDELITLAKMYPNVFVNLCWLPQYATTIYRDILSLAIDILPLNKIFGFGGDYFFIEGTYAAQKLARKTISTVLYQKVIEKNLTIDDATVIAENYFYKNAFKVYMKKN